jgi:hypothetical protein
MKSQQVNFSVRDRGSFRSDQNAIWDEVSKKARRRDAVSPSMAMSEIYEKEKPAIDQYIEGFNIIDSQVGAAFMINGEMAGMDCRLDTKKITGFALCHENQIPHMSVFSKSDIETQGARLHSFSRRRRHRL